MITAILKCGCLMFVEVSLTDFSWYRLKKIKLAQQCIARKIIFNTCPQHEQTTKGISQCYNIIEHSLYQPTQHSNGTIKFTSSMFEMAQCSSNLYSNRDISLSANIVSRRALQPTILQSGDV